jgi:protein ImuB
VTEVQLAAESTAAASEQLGLFARQPRRDLAAANRALARVRAELGERAVCRAAVRSGHLPEAQHRWELLDRLPAPAPPPLGASGDDEEAHQAVLVRRVLQRPRLLGQRIDMLADLRGPYVLSGGWWRKEVTRDYYFARTREGALLWIYFDRQREAWMLHGLVE